MLILNIKFQLAENANEYFNLRKTVGSFDLNAVSITVDQYPV